MPSCFKTPTPCRTQRGEARRQRLLDVAAEVFMEQGYAGASVNEIVRRAGGSLSTLYRLFGNKLGLFEAMIAQRTEVVFAPFEAEGVWTDDLEATLLAYGRHIQSRLVEAHAVEIFRLVVSERGEDRERIQQFFHDAGPRRGQRLLADYLRTQVEKGRLRSLDCDMAACQFIDMTRAPFYYRLLFGHPPDEVERERALQQALSLFLQGARMPRESE
ncbi:MULTISPECIES: TetR/AcrR family transcriptional regulator [unclassified Ectothiorhodospira]|uniref:TetR/AcrR family transcriptional regulator n=1 Tax=unclassified Ectothiorhodospira TaxID=2684909 RepID=UPI002105C6D4|nr:MULTISPECIES: TetR/AcrR family transcriptional regulator [unclassified Ectothiorhodospira]